MTARSSESRSQSMHDRIGTKQVDASHYRSNYDERDRWNSYWQQIQQIKQHVPPNQELLEIGPGNHTVYNYLKNFGYSIESLDFDEELEPDHVGDVRDIPLPDNSFHTVCAFEVLEHIPWEDVDTALQELGRVAQEKVLISVPHKEFTFKLGVSCHYNIYFEKRFSLPIPVPKRGHEFDGQHYWELGSKNTSEQDLRRKLSQYFEIGNEFRDSENQYHHFYVLEECFERTEKSGLDLNHCSENPVSVRAGTDNVTEDSVKAATERTGGVQKRVELRTKVFRKYKWSIYPRVKHLRGATWLLGRLEDLAYSELPVSEEEPTKIDELEWDNLVIIDGCREDLYKQVVNTEVETRISSASSSPEFISNNFSEGDWEDTVMITANPHFEEELFEELTGAKPREVFHEIFEVYETDWDYEQSTVYPKDVVEKALTAEKLWPEKRKIVWFMQPHYPFIPADIEERGMNDSKNNDELTSWDLAEKGRYKQETVWKAYRQNLEYVLPHVRKVSDKLSGKSIVTSDHGNLVGEKGLYGHPGNVHHEKLVEVPLEIKPEKDAENKEVDEAFVR